MEGEQTPFVPDWRDEKNYTDHGKDLEAWAWEFLRRNPSYQGDYSIWQSLPDDDGEGNYSPKYSDTPCLADDTAFYHCTPHAEPGETVAQFEARTGYFPDTWYSYISERWKVVQPHDPANPYGPAFYLDNIPPYEVDFVPQAFDFGPRTDWGRIAMEHMAGRLLNAPWPEEIDSNVVVLGFDLRFPIDDQTTAANKHLKELRDSRKAAALGFGLDIKRKQRGTAHEDKRIVLLQILDALREGSDDVEIIKELYSGKAKPTPAGSSQAAQRAQDDEQQRFQEASADWLNKARRRAKEICKSRYLEWVLWAAIPKSKK